MALCCNTVRNVVLRLKLVGQPWLSVIRYDEQVEGREFNPQPIQVISITRMSLGKALYDEFLIVSCFLATKVTLFYRKSGDQANTTTLCFGDFITMVSLTNIDDPAHI